MARTPLLETHTITFHTPTGAGNYDAEGQWVRAAGETTQDVLGSLQPYSPNKTTLVLPEGTRSKDAKIFLSKTNIQDFDQYTEKSASWITHNGEKYTIFDYADWTGYGLKADHYEYILLMDNPK